ncbi:MAG TPA: hypothetical protein VFU82_01310 [Gammaproteobacteria bacterium]|nr:hypothetical protein [Gammaproteobacteria bacterium]
MKKNLEVIFTHTGDRGEVINLQYDKNNNLYVNGKKLLTQKKISLRWYELILLTLTTLGVLTEAIVSAMPYIKMLF